MKGPAGLLFGQQAGPLNRSRAWPVKPPAMLGAWGHPAEQDLAQRPDVAGCILTLSDPEPIGWGTGRYRSYSLGIRYAVAITHPVSLLPALCYTTCTWVRWIGIEFPKLIPRLPILPSMACALRRKHWQAEMAECLRLELGQHEGISWLLRIEFACLP